MWRLFRYLVRRSAEHFSFGACSVSRQSYPSSTFSSISESPYLLRLGQLSTIRDWVLCSHSLASPPRSFTLDRAKGEWNTDTRSPGRSSSSARSGIFSERVREHQRCRRRRDQGECCLCGPAAGKEEGRRAFGGFGVLVVAAAAATTAGQFTAASIGVATVGYRLLQPWAFTSGVVYAAFPGWNGLPAEGCK